MTKEQAFVVSDVHGCYFELVALLENWNPDTQELIINGDLVDRGSHSKEVLLTCYKLMLDGHIVLRGNHDQMLLDYITAPERELADMYYTWFFQGGRETSESILDTNDVYNLTPKALKDALLENAYVKDTLELTEHFYEWGNVLFVHAGISPMYQADWKTAPKSDMLWTRDCHKNPNITGKVIVSGHTPTQIIHRDKQNDIWINSENNVIMIDGACAYGGQLNGVVLDKTGTVVQTYRVTNGR